MRVLAIALLALAVFQFKALAQEDIASEIAKVELDDIEQLLLERAFAKKSNEKLRNEYQDNLKMEKAAAEKMQEALREGGMFNPMDFAKDFMLSDRKFTDTIENLAKAELILIIEELYGEKYKLVLNETYAGSILYTSVFIPDITPNIKQYLLKQKAKKAGE